MDTSSYVLVTDRGGHLHNARMLMDQMQIMPRAILTTYGPELEALQHGNLKTYRIPYLFTWVGKKRFWNPFKSLYAFFHAAFLVAVLRPAKVISLGASDVVPFCFVARLAGAQIIHVECMNQVTSPSVTGRLLYPICKAVYVQWPELLSAYGGKARYAGWVLGNS